MADIDLWPIWTLPVADLVFCVADMAADIDVLVEPSDLEQSDSTLAFYVQPSRPYSVCNDTRPDSLIDFGAIQDLYLLTYLLTYSKNIGEWPSSPFILTSLVLRRAATATGPRVDKVLSRSRAVRYR